MQESLLKLFSLGAIVLFICIVCFLILEAFSFKNPIKTLIVKYQMMLLFAISFVAVIGSLSLSIYFKLAPCELCWYQRVFLFTLPVISWIAIYKNDMQARLYVFVLSLIGSLFALYHTLIQSSLFKADSIFCNPASASIDCAVPAFEYFGFVTVPVISLVVFGLLMILSFKYKN